MRSVLLELPPRSREPNRSPTCALRPPTPATSALLRSVDGSYSSALAIRTSKVAHHHGAGRSGGHPRGCRESRNSKARTAGVYLRAEASEPEDGLRAIAMQKVVVRVPSSALFERRALDKKR